MNSSLSIPTDNPYKLMAISGVVIFVFSLYFLANQSAKYNDLVFKSFDKMFEISTNNKLSENDKSSAEAMILERLDFRKTEQRFVPLASGIMAAIGAFLFAVGFWKWFKIIYPIEEAIRKEQLTQLKKSNLAASRSRFSKRT